MAYIYNLTDTWNAAGTTFSGIKMAVTNTASSASSSLLDLSVSGATTASFVVSRTGSLSLNGPIQTAVGSAAAPAISTSAANTGLFYPDTTTIGFSTAGSERMRISSAGNVGIGVTPGTNTSLSIANAPTTGQNSFGVNIDYAIQSNATVAGTYFRSVGSVVASHTLPTLRHYYAVQGAFGAGSTVTNQFGFFAENSLTGATNNYGFYSNIASGTGRWNFYANGTANNAFAGNSRFGGATAPVATVDVTGSVAATTTILSSGATSGIGYATGAGGTVTQGTSRTTGVTIDKVCGQITLFSAAGSTSWQSFTVTNSAVASTDTIIVNQDTGTDLYQIFVTNVAAGSFRITFATTGGTTTEQPVFGFSVIKAVAA